MRWKKARSFISIASSGLNFPGKLSYVHVETEYANQMWVPKILAASEQMEPFWACSLQSANPCKIIFQLCCKKGAADKQRHPFCSTRLIYFFKLSSTATATATVAPTMGLLPIPKNPIISTWAGTEEEPANWASECMRPMVSVIP